VKILIVDDVADAAESLATLLRVMEGYDCRVALSGGQALSIISQNAPDLIILDLIMPGINGWQLLDAMLHSEYCKIPVIVVSGAARLPQPLTSQVQAILVKPARTETLLRAIADALYPATAEV
jgi:CheY-like chemotaxis protein